MVARADDLLDPSGHHLGIVMELDMSEIRESNWIAIDTIGSSYEEQIDVNASDKAAANAKFRHRPIARTGSRAQRPVSNRFRPVR